MIIKNRSGNEYRLEKRERNGWKVIRTKTSSEEIVTKLREFSFIIRKVLSKKIVMKFLPKLFFVKDESFDYAEKIENLIKQANK